MSQPELNYPNDENTAYEAEDVLVTSDFHPELIEGGLLDEVDADVFELEDIQSRLEPIDDLDNEVVITEELQTASPENMDSLDLYLRKATETPLLKAHEEVELAKKIEAGNEARQTLLRYESGELEQMEPETQAQTISELETVARDGQRAKDHMTNANLRLVVSVVKGYRGNGVPFLELISEGNIGLMRAVEKFDHRRGFKFSTYATWWIRQSAQRHLGNTKNTIRVPIHVSERQRKIQKAKQNHSMKYGEEPTDEEIQAETGISLKQILEAKKALDRQPTSLNKLINDDNYTELETMVSDETALSVEDEVINSIDTADRYLRRLDPRERKIIELRYELNGEDRPSLDVIGKELGITRERVRQIESRGLKRLRAMLEADGLV